MKKLFIKGESVAYLTGNKSEIATAVIAEVVPQVIGTHYVLEGLPGKWTLSVVPDTLCKVGGKRTD